MRNLLDFTGLGTPCTFHLYHLHFVEEFFTIAVELILRVAVLATSVFLGTCLGVIAMKLIPRLTHQDGWGIEDAFPWQKAIGASTGGWMLKTEGRTESM